MFIKQTKKDTITIIVFLYYHKNIPIYIDKNNNKIYIYILSILFQMTF